MPDHGGPVVRGGDDYRDLVEADPSVADAAALGEPTIEAASIRRLSALGLPSGGKPSLGSSDRATSAKTRVPSSSRAAKTARKCNDLKIGADMANGKPGRPAKYSKEFKENAVDYTISSGKTYAQAAADLGVLYVVK